MATDDFRDTHKSARDRLNANLPRPKKRRGFNLGRALWMLVKIG